MTKTAFILPFFDLLGYDRETLLNFMQNLQQILLMPRERNLYAILIDDVPRILSRS